MTLIADDAIRCIVRVDAVIGLFVNFFLSHCTQRRAVVWGFMLFVIVAFLDGALYNTDDVLNAGSLKVT